MAETREMGFRTAFSSVLEEHSHSQARSRHGKLPREYEIARLGFYGADDEGVSEMYLHMVSAPAASPEEVVVVELA